MTFQFIEEVETVYFSKYLANAPFMCIYDILIMMNSWIMQGCGYATPCNNIDRGIKYLIYEYNMNILIDCIHFLVFIFLKFKFENIFN